MPRKARIDAPGALHHVIVRGIEKKAIMEVIWAMRSGLKPATASVRQEVIDRTSSGLIIW